MTTSAPLPGKGVTVVRGLRPLRVVGFPSPWGGPAETA
jgi:hypothetical protein